MRIFIPKSVLLILLLILSLSGFRYGNDLFEFSKHLEIFSNVYKTVQEEYMDEVPASEMAQHAIKSMLQKLDPYTVFYTEYQAEEALIERQGEYGGVGCRVQIRNQFPMVIDIEKGYGFDKAGVKHGDILLKAGDVNLKNRSLDEMMQFFRGAPNSIFTVTLLRGSDTLTKKVTRGQIEQKSVSFQSPINSEYGYIKLDEFGQNCAQEIEQALKIQIDSHHIKGLVLDLRHNGGGLLDQAVEIVGLFVPKNTVIVNLKGVHKMGVQPWKTPKEPLAPNLPLVVLINESSASASEVVSGSLQDLDRALILGSRSFGKGLVQNYKNLPYRTQMKITTARYHIPSGRCIQKIDYRRTETNANKAFKTKNGRIVYDGSGVLPDIVSANSNKKSLIDWAKREFLLFDYINEKENYWRKKGSIESWDLLSDFTNYAIKEGTLKMDASFKEMLGRDKDSSIFQYENLIKLDTKIFQNWLSYDIKENSSSYLYELRRALYLRWYNKSEYHKEMLDKDPLIQQATFYLGNPSKINAILNPR